MRASRYALFALALLLAWPAAAAQADYESGVLAYDRGRFAVAVAEFRRLAERGHAGAEFMLGAMYFYGKGVRRDDALAAVWFHKAALKNNPNAQLAFGSLHIRGLGVGQDLIKAYMWLTLSADHGVSGLQQQAQALREEAARLMRPEEVAEARRRARQWRPLRPGLTYTD